MSLVSSAKCGWVTAYASANRLLVLFTLIDPSDAKREFSFVLDCNAQDYVVPQCDPPIADMADLVQRLNGDRDLHSFIKRGE